MTTQACAKKLADKYQDGSGTITRSAGSARWYYLFVLVLAYGVHNLDKQIVSILIQPLKLEFGISDFQVSILGGVAASLPFALFCIPMGMLADRSNRKVTLSIVIVLWSAATALGGFANSLLLLFMSRALVGGLESGFSPLSMSLIADYFHPRERSTALGFFAIGAPLGTFMAMVLGAIVAAHLGWCWAFWLAGVPGVLLALLIALTFKEPSRSSQKPAFSRHSATGIRLVLGELFSDVALTHTILGMVFSVTLLAAVAIWLPTLLVRTHGLDLRQAGIWSALVVGGVGAFGAALGGLLADRAGRGRESRKVLLVIFSIILSSAFLLCGMLLDLSLEGLLVCVAISAFFSQIVFGTGYGLVIRLSPPERRATVLATLVVALNFISYSLGSSMAGWISDRLADSYGGRSIAYGMAATCLFSLVGAIHLFVVYLSLKRRSL